jgi:predicted RNA-binding Zn-ribbon protein involved in translation (DUF1610 family)
VLTADSVNKATRRYWVTVYIGIVPLIVLLGLNGRIARWLAESLSSYGMQLKWQTLSLAIMVVTLALMFCTIFLTQSRTLPKCSTCGKRITPNMAGLVIATKHCPKCGSQLIAPVS